MGGYQIVEAGPLRLTTRDPDDRLEGPHRGVRGVRVGGLRVVDPGDSVVDAHRGDPVPTQVEVAQPLGDRRRRHPQAAGQRGRGQCILDVVRGGRLNVGDAGQREGEVATLGDEGAVDQQIVHHPQHADGRYSQGEADRAGAFDHLGVLDHLLGDRLGHVVDAGMPHVVVNARLVGHVSGHCGVAVAEPWPVPFQVVGVDVQHGRRMQLERMRPVQLEAGQFDRQHVIGDLVVECLDDGAPDVAHRRRPQAARPQHRIQHLGGGGLPVGSGDPEPRHDPVGMHQTPGKLDIAPDRHLTAGGLDEQCVVGTPARRGDHQVDVSGQQRR